MNAVKVLSFSVVGESYDEIYIKIMKRFNKIAKKMDNPEKVCFNFTKAKAETGCLVEVSLMVFVDPKEMEDRFCATCKEFHCNFYINTRYNCNTCKYKAYKKKMSEELRYAKRYVKKKLQ